MKQRFAMWIVLVTWAVWTQAAQTPASSVGHPASASTNQSVASVTNEVEATKPPGDLYTNAIEMVLLKTSSTVWAGKYEVTQKEYQQLIGSNPSQFGGETRPVDSVSWNEAVDFCRRLTELDLQKKKFPPEFYYTLPTEDEWHSLMADAEVDDAVTSLNGMRSGTSAVGSLRPNSLGLYDVRGNVMEFTQGDNSKPYRVLLGGSWADFIDINLRPEFRFYCQPDERKNTFGFRCVLKQK